MKKRKKRRIGSSLVWAAVAAAFLAPCIGLGLKDKGRKAAAEYAIVAGTVFREDGRSLQGASVEITARSGGGHPKFKKQRAVSDARGEFAFRVPPEEATYAVSVQASGYQSQHKEVTVAGIERRDVFFNLERASK